MTFPGNGYLQRVYRYNVAQCTIRNCGNTKTIILKSKNSIDLKIHSRSPLDNCVFPKMGAGGGESDITKTKTHLLNFLKRESTNKNDI